MSSGLERILNEAFKAPKNIPATEIAGMLSCRDSGFASELFAAAREMKAKVGKTRVLPRGLIEVSNACAKDCHYCGIRKSRSGVGRYHLSGVEVAECAEKARALGYDAIALQSGELESEENTAFYERCVSSLGLKAPNPLEITLSLGEQTEATYRRWQDAGAMRYLLRIETSNRELYARIHPSECSFERRLECIRTLKRLGYVTGSGVMIGLPGQTMADLADDIVLFGVENLDMVGMGPFIPCEGTPMALSAVLPPVERLDLALKMIAITRLYMHDINIVAATALEVLDADGRTKGIDAGANVIMPNLTPSEHRAEYALYPGKAEA